MKHACATVLLALLGTACFGQCLINETFTTENTSLWPSVRIFEPFSALTYTSKGLILSRNEKQKPIEGRLFDTAFELHSAPLPLPVTATHFDFSLQLGTDKPSFGNCRGYKDGYQNRLVWFDEHHEQLPLKPFYYSPVFAYPLDNPGWNTFRGTIPPAAKSVQIQFGFDTPDFKSGEKALLAGMRLTVGTEADISALPPAGGLDHSVTRLTPSPVADGAAPIRLKINHADTVDWNSFRLQLDGQDITNTVKRENAVIHYLPPQPLNAGLHTLSINVQDLNGTRHTSPCFVYVGPPRTYHAVTIREDGMPVIDGKPFFMLGIACLVKQGRNGNSYDKAFAEAAAAGMNFARHWSSYNMDSSDAADYIAAARKYGLYISMSPTLVKNDTNVEAIAKGVAKQLDVKQILAWDIGDDTSEYVSAQTLLAKHNAVHAVDTSRLTTQADPVGINKGKLLDNSRYTHYVHASDTFQPEIYPIGNVAPGQETPEISATWVPEVITNLKQIHQDWTVAQSAPRPIWPLIQYFHYSATSKNWNRMPTRDELRAMSYLAVIHGSHGIFWYRYAGYPKTDNATRGYSDEQWTNLASICQEFRALYDMYCTRPVPQTQSCQVLDGPAQDALGYPSINSLLKKHNGKVYLIVCNSAAKPVHARFTVPQTLAATEFFEQRKLPLGDASFTDGFASYGVHVYEITCR